MWKISQLISVKHSKLKFFSKALTFTRSTTSSRSKGEYMHAMRVEAHFFGFCYKPSFAMVYCARILRISPFSIARMVKSIVGTPFALSATFSWLLFQKHVASFLTRTPDVFGALYKSILKDKKNCMKLNFTKTIPIFSIFT